ncbi:hypothetical protein CHU92_03465 [Flavobacterium cyanobacteriorum]|uniref:Uncharacterized protein n=1 Tax=Flavobacterium cyanobacteriorum TaxID=2022802 RepID=A0A255ZP95_9FLAO|nr:hypothetical protein [Flavobacterium cyanobacteriorum]OYQ43407.1 hypothetical protein CHU92_03465 [Flavobacterium cyanobacteriorum]
MSKQSYINFLWNSSNLHGVHSPFVFGYISKAFYAKAARLTKREHNAATGTVKYQPAELLYRIISNTKSSKLFILGEEAVEITEMLRKLGEANSLQLWFFSLLAPIPGGADLAYISGKDKEEILPLFEQAVPNMGKNKVCIIGNIHSSAATEKAWSTIKNDPRVTVTIDAYYMGLVFFRHGQAKQHFVIRATTSWLTDVVLGFRNLWGLLG